MSSPATTPSLATDGGPIDFSDYIQQKTVGFTGREWVFADIDEWLQDKTADRFYRLGGEPGAGKSAIAAQLVRISQGSEKVSGDWRKLGQGFLTCHHFCYSRDNRWIDPLTFAHSLALQLSARYSEFARALVETSSRGSVEISASLQIGAVTGGQVVGNWINTLNVPSMSAQKAFGLLVREPLQRFLGEKPEQSILILVDAIDESLTFRGDDNILALLSRTEQLRSVRFLVTTRPDSRVEAELPAPVGQEGVGRRGVFLSSDARMEENRADIKAFVRSRWDGAGTAPDTVDQIVEKAAGNFQYVTFLLNTLASGFLSVNDVPALPPGLDDLYLKSIEQVVRMGGKDVDAAYKPTLGILCVAREGLTCEQLQNFTGQKESTVLSILRDLEPFLHEAEPADPQADSRYRIFHRSFVDMLNARKLRGGTLKNPYYIPLAEQHRAIVDYYKQEQAWAAMDWAHMDNYGLLHVPNHVDQLHGVPGYKGALEQVICAPLMWARWSRYRSRASFADDVRLMIAAATCSTPQEVCTEIRGSLILATLRSMAANTPPAAIRALGFAGHFEEAYGHAALISDAEARQEALLMVHRAMSEGGAPSYARQLFQDSIKGLFPSNLPAAAPALAEHGALDRIGPSLALAKTQSQVWIRKSIIASLCSAGKQDAALSVIDSIEDEEEQVQGLSALIASSSGNADPLISRALLIARSIQGFEARASALSYVADSLLRRGDLEEAKQLGSEALQLVDGASPEWAMMSTVCRVAPAMARCGELERVCASALRLGEHEATKEEMTAKEPRPAARADRGDGSAWEAESLVSETEAQAARLMAARLTGFSVITQVPETGFVVIRGGLTGNDIRANALNWIVQTMVADESEQPQGKQVAEQLQAALEALPPAQAGMKAVALAYVALLFAQAGEKEAAHTLVRAILKTLEEAPVSPTIYKDLLVAVCPALVLAGDLDLAVSFTREIRPKKSDRDKAVLDEVWIAIAAQATRAGMDAQTLGMLSLVVDENKRMKALIHTVENLRDQEEFDAATILAAIGEINGCIAERLPPASRLKVQANVASRLADLGQLERAAELARRVIEESEVPADLSAKTRAQAWIAEALAKAGEADKAAAIAAEGASGADPESYILGFTDWARALARCGRTEDAVAALSRLDDGWRNKAFALRDVALATADAGDFPKARTTAELIAIRPVRAEALALIAECLVQQKQNEQAAQVANEANALLKSLDEIESNPKPEPSRPPTKLTKMLGEPEETGPALWRIVDVLVRAGQQESAAAIARAAVDCLGKLKISDAADAVLALAIAGFEQQAGELATSVLDQIPKAGFSSEQGTALSLIARLFLREDRFNEAEKICESILGAPAFLDGTTGSMLESNRWNVLLEIGSGFYAGGQTDRAAKLLDRLLAKVRPLAPDPAAVRCKGRVLLAYTRFEPQKAEPLWREQLNAAHNADRLCLFDTVRYGAFLLAGKDGGKTLCKVYESIQEVETWWKAPHSVPPKAMESRA